MWNSESGNFPKFVVDLIHINSDKSATPSRFNALFAYPAHLVCWHFTERLKTYMTDHGHTLLAFLAAGAAEMRNGFKEQEVDDRMSVHGFTSSKVVDPESPVA